MKKINDRNVILETERLLLEEVTDAHFPDLIQLLSNERVHRYFPKTLNRTESLQFFERIQQRQKDSGLSFWAVILKESNDFIGICGLLKQLIDDVTEVELGYRLNDAYWGNGYGTEAAAGCQTYAKNVLGLKSIISLILPINQPSIRVAEKNGLILEKETLFYDQIHRVYRKTFD